jgi:glutamine amidotransferase
VPEKAFNVLLSDGCLVMAYCSNNPCWSMRRAPFGKDTFLDQDVMIDFQQQTTPDDMVTVIATQPLSTSKTCNRIAIGEFALFHFGERPTLG